MYNEPFGWPCGAFLVNTMRMGQNEKDRREERSFGYEWPDDGSTFYE